MKIQDPNWEKLLIENFDFSSKKFKKCDWSICKVDALMAAYGKRNQYAVTSKEGYA